MRDSWQLLKSFGGSARLWILAGLAALSAAIEAVSATLVFVFLQIVVEQDGAIDVPVIGNIAETWPTLETERGTLFFASALGAFFVLRALLLIGIEYLQQRHAETVAANLSINLVEGYLALPYSYHIDRRSAALIRNATETAQRLAVQVFLPLIRIVADSLILFALLFVLAAAAPVATAAVILLIGPLVGLSIRALQLRLRRLGERLHTLSAVGLSILQQGLRGIRDVHLYGAQQHFGYHFRIARHRLARTQYLRGTGLIVPSATLEAALLLFILGFFVIAVGAGSSGPETVAMLGLFAYAGLRLLPSLKKVILSTNQVRFNSPAVEELVSDLEMFGSPEQRSEPREEIAFSGGVTLVGAGYRYPGATEQAISDISLSIPQGQSLGICGPTGSGKSTLLDLLTGLLAPTSGVVLVDGQPMADVADAWQKELGVVSQHMFFLDDTLRQNIAFGIEPQSIDEAALQVAISAAQLREFVDRLPRGLDSQVGESGVMLSGGQLQRIAIARALYRKPHVLIFDEATSALDNLTESHVMDAIRQSDPDRTVVLVAHRLSTVRWCDQIVYLEEGRVVATGTYEELVHSNAAFRAQATAG